MEDRGNQRQCWFVGMAIVKMSPIGIEKDKYGVKLKYPNRRCESCAKYPCFPEIKKCSSNFAAYGCVYYKDVGSDV